MQRQTEAPPSPAASDMGGVEWLHRRKPTAWLTPVALDPRSSNPISPQFMCA
ncbi:MAG: hypothetical protein LAN61_05940 [Acidobacteriia bacterium]|nr:hypothetical protein [Terriglobia bacterium]